MFAVQNIIHRLEVGAGLRFFKCLLVGLAVLSLMLAYDFRRFGNMSNPEAMDNAQLARNLATQKGYSTLFIRPLSVYLLEKTSTDNLGPAPIGDLSDRARLKTLHPDLANPPLYPLLLAGLMKVIPAIRHQPAISMEPGSKKFNLWTRGGNFSIYPPDFGISLFNQGLFLITMALVYFISRRLFDSAVAWTSAAIFLGTDLFWRFSMSGISTMLVMLLFVILAWCLSLLEQGVRAAKSPRSTFLLAALAGLVLGLGCLARYSFGWLIIPVIVFLLLFSKPRRAYTCLITLFVFAIVVIPWIARNYHLSHAPFGTATYAIYETTTYFPEFRLERSLNPDLSRAQFFDICGKIMANTRVIIQDDLLKFSGSWVSAFFLVGLLINFKNSTLGRLRYFVLFCVPILVFAQAAGRTHLSETSPIINSENLLVLLSPLVIIFGVSLFFILLDQLPLPLPQLRYVCIAVFCIFLCLPAALTIISPRANPIAYPPYYPPTIQITSSWMKQDELIMSDIPWAVAWYGERQSLWLTLNAQSEFENFTDYKKTISAIYLTPLTTDGRILSQLGHVNEQSWGAFMLDSMIKHELPPKFPLQHGPSGFMPEQVFLTDYDRWVVPNPTTSSSN